MQATIVFLIVAAAAGYAAWQLMPQRLRRWLIARGAAIAPSRSAWLVRLEATAEEGACGSCKGCATDGAPAAGKAQSPGHSTIRIHPRSDR